jgi:hypothetical protein
MSEETIEEEGDEITKYKRQIIQSTSYKSSTPNVDTIIKCDYQTMEYGQILEWKAHT